jgi:hypothetical protein
MNWESIISGAVTAALISGGFAFRQYTHQKKLDFQYDYRKYVLEKRKQAYERIEALIKRLSEKMIVHSHPSMSFHKIFTFQYNANTTPLQLFLQDLDTATYESFWLSDKIMVSMGTLTTKIADYLKEAYQEHKTETTDLTYFGMRKFNELEELRKEAYKIYFDDLMNLNQIDRFIKEKTLM